ncbi:hypothetical protein AAY473_030861 [Plecturocebus cupreus]
MALVASAAHVHSARLAGCRLSSWPQSSSKATQQSQCLQPPLPYLAHRKNTFCKASLEFYLQDTVPPPHGRKADIELIRLACSGMILAHCNFNLLGSSGITGVRHHTHLIFIFLVEIGFHHVGQVGLELLTSNVPPTSDSQSAGITATACSSLAVQAPSDYILTEPQEEDISGRQLSRSSNYTPQHGGMRIHLLGQGGKTHLEDCEKCLREIVKGAPLGLRFIKIKLAAK